MTAPLNMESFLLIGVAGVFTGLLLLEKRSPYIATCTRRLRASFSTNTTAFAFNNIVMSVLSVSSLLAVAGRHADVGVLGALEDGPVKWLASFVLFDFAVYVWHWLGHRFESLWRFHKVHHSDKTVHVSTGLRFHIFEQLLEVVYKCAAVVIIGMSAPVVVVCEILRMFFVLFHHANIAIPHEKLLSYFIITPSLHRVHHSTRRSEHDSNYGIVLAIWDIIFGTRKELTPKSIGLNLIEAENFAQLFSLAFLTEQELAGMLHLMPRERRSGQV